MNIFFQNGSFIKSPGIIDMEYCPCCDSYSPVWEITPDMICVRCEQKKNEPTAETVDSYK